MVALSEANYFSLPNVQLSKTVITPITTPTAGCRTTAAASAAHLRTPVTLPRVTDDGQRETRHDQDHQDQTTPINCLDCEGSTSAVNAKTYFLHIVIINKHFKPCRACSRTGVGGAGPILGRRPSFHSVAVRHHARFTVRRQCTVVRGTTGTQYMSNVDYATTRHRPLRLACRRHGDLRR